MENNNPWNERADLVKIIEAQNAASDAFFKTTALAAQDVKSQTGPICSIFGSARLEEAVPRIYSEIKPIAIKLSTLLAQAGWAHLNGCCPGIGEEHEKTHRSTRHSVLHQPIIGVRILLADPDTGNADFEDTDHSRAEAFLANESFGTRIAIMEAFASGCIAYPGGVGTLLEVVKFLQMHQLAKYTGRRLPIVLIGKEYWAPLEAMFDNMIAWGTMREGEIEPLITDSPEEAFAYLQAFNGNAKKAEWARQEGLAEASILELPFAAAAS